MCEIRLKSSIDFVVILDHKKLSSFYISFKTSKLILKGAFFNPGFFIKASSHIHAMYDPRECRVDTLSSQEQIVLERCTI